MRWTNRSAWMALAACGVLASGCACPRRETGATTAPECCAPPVARSDAGPSLERFLKIRTPSSPTLMPDGQLLVRDWPDGIWQLYRFTPAGDARTPDYRPGHATATKLTDFKDGLGGYSLSPDGTKIVLSHATGGNENYRLSLLDASAPGPEGLTPLIAKDRVQAAINVWLDDSSGFIYSANDESPNDFYLYRYDLGSHASTKLLGREGAWSAGDVTRDGSRLLVSRFVSASDSSVFQLDAASAATTELTLRDAETPAANDVVGYMPGETSVLLLSDRRGGMKRLYQRDLASGAVTSPIPALDAFEIDGAGLSEERDLLVVVTNEDGYAVPHLYELPGFTPLAAPTDARGVIGVGGLRDRRLVWTLNNAQTPGLAFATAYPKSGARAAGPSAVPLTHAETQGIDLSRFPLPALVRYEAFDGREIPAFVFFPPGYDPAKPTPIPFVVNYHGGPEGQSRPVFSATIQYLLSEGYGVMQPNVRGSTGYGRAFHMLDDYTGRWDSVRDGVDAAEWLVREGYARRGKIAAYGGSYGGFMAVACIVEDQLRVDAGTSPARVFGAGVDVVGIVNLRTFLEQTSGYRRKLREVEYGPLTDPDFLASVSSIHRIDKINVPMMIAHGLNDPRVPVGEAMQLAIGLKKKGLDPVEFYAPDEGHGFAKLENRLLFTERMAKFLGSTIGR